MAKPDENQTLKCLELLSQIEPSPEDVKKSLKRVQQVLLNQEEKIKSSSNKPWRTIVKNNPSRFVAAAVIIIAIFLGIQHFIGNLSISSVVWAEVSKNVENIQTSSAMCFSF